MQQVLQIYHASINPRFSFHGFTFILLFWISGFSPIPSDVSHGSFDMLRYTPLHYWGSDKFVRIEFHFLL